MARLERGLHAFGGGKLRLLAICIGLSSSFTLLAGQRVIELNEI